MSSDNAERYTQYGDYSLQRLDLIKNGEPFDLRYVFAELNIFMNLFSPNATATLSIVDSNDFYSEVGFEKGDVISTKFRTKGSTTHVDMEFVVYNIDDYLDVSLGTKIYKIYLTTQDAINNIATNTSSHQSGTISNIVKNVYSFLESGKDIDVEDTIMLKDYVLPKRTVFDTMVWLSSQAYGQDNSNSPSFVFYETADGYNFKSIDTLISQEPVSDYGRAVSAVATSSRDAFYSIKDYEVSTRDSLLQNAEDGLYRVNTTVFDLTTREQSLQQFLPEDSNVLRTEENADLTKEHSLFHLQTSESQNFKKPYGPRQAILGSMYNKKIDFMISGNSGLSCGDVVTVNLHDEPKKNLVIALRHIVKPKSYECSVTSLEVNQ